MYEKQCLIPFIEFYARAETNYESYGHFKFVRKFFKISEELFEKIKNINLDNKQEVIDILTKSDEIINSKETKILYDILDIARGIEIKDITNLIDYEEMEEYYSYSNDIKSSNCAIELSFHKEDDSLDGYFSVYKISLEELQKENEFDIDFKKYLSYN